MKNRSLWICAAAAFVAAAALAGCGGTTYFAGRNLPPSKLTNRVLIAIQNPSSFTQGSLQFVDAYYDIRGGYNGTPPAFSISGFSGALPVTIQNMPEEQAGAIYSSGDGTFNLINYGTEAASGSAGGTSGLSSSIFISRNLGFVFAASQSAHVLTVLNRVSNSTYTLSLPGVYRVSVNPGGTLALAFVQNSNYVYYPVALSAAQTIAYSGGPSTWPKAAVDCQPLNGPGWCLFQAQSPDNIDATGHSYGAPLAFDRPVKAVFSPDGGTAYILNCGPECGGTASSVSLLPVSPMIFPIGQASGALPKTGAIANIPVPGGASNALVDISTLYVIGQRPVNVAGQALFTGNLTVVNLQNNSVVPSTSAVPNPVPISDGAPGARSRMLLADDNTLWIGMTKCNNGARAATGQSYGCLTMFDTNKNTLIMLEPYQGDATGIAAVTGLHKIYTAEGGQVYIYKTTDGTAIDNQYVTVTGTAYDVAYMDAESDSDNTVY